MKEQEPHFQYHQFDKMLGYKKPQYEDGTSRAIPLSTQIMRVLFKHKVFEKIRNILKGKL